MSLKQKLIKQAEEYCKKRKISKARLSTIVVNDGKFFDRIENKGCDFTVGTYEKFQKFFDEKSQEEEETAA